MRAGRGGPPAMASCAVLQLPCHRRWRVPTVANGACCSIGAMFVPLPSRSVGFITGTSMAPSTLRSTSVCSGRGLEGRSNLGRFGCPASLGEDRLRRPGSILQSPWARLATLKAACQLCVPATGVNGFTSDCGAPRSCPPSRQAAGSANTTVQPEHWNSPFGRTAPLSSRASTRR